jgi:hypothetical protein
MTARPWDSRSFWIRATEQRNRLGQCQRAAMSVSAPVAQCGPQLSDSFFYLLLCNTPRSVDGRRACALSVWLERARLSKLPISIDCVFDASLVPGLNRVRLLLENQPRSANLMGLEGNIDFDAVGYFDEWDPAVHAKFLAVKSHGARNMAVARSLTLGVNC